LHKQINPKMAEVLTPEKRLAQLNAEIEAENLANAEKDKSGASEEQKLADEKAAADEAARLEAEKDKGNEKSPEEIAEEERIAAEKVEADKIEANKPPVKTWEELSAEAEEAEISAKKQAKWEKAKESKIVNKILELEEEGKSIEEIADAIASLKKFDTKDLTDDQLLMLIVANDKNDDGSPLSDDEKARAIENLKDLSPSMLKTALDAKRAEVEAKRLSEIEKFTNDKKSALTKVNECIPLIKGKCAEIYNTEVDGILMTHDLTKEYNLEASRQLIACTDVNGNINMEKVFDRTKKIVLFDAIEAKAKEAGRKQGLKEAFTENHNPSEDGKLATSKSPQKKTKEELEDEAVQAVIAARNPQRKKVLTNN